MLRKKTIYGSLAIIGTASFALAMIVPIIRSLPFAGDVSVWRGSPLICCALIASVALAASLPLWCARRRAWLAPLLVSCIILVPAIAICYSFIANIVSPHPTSYSLLSFGAEYPVSLIPAYLSAMSFSLLFAGALIARRMRDPFVTDSGRDRETGGKAPASAFSPGGKQP
jgi:hypothetical protein